MPIVGGRPEHGLRIDLDRTDEAGKVAYAGQISTPDADFPVKVEVRGEEIAVELAEGAPADLAERVRLLVRSVLKHADSEGQPPPRRIQRWRDSR